MSREEKLDDFFASRDTSLEDIEAAGWKVRVSSGGGWWYELGRPGDPEFKRQPLPCWVHELIERNRKLGRSDAQREMRQAMGINKRTDST